MQESTTEQRPSIEAIAFHEAGHALAQFHVEIPIRYVTIVSKGDTLGRSAGRVRPWFDLDSVSARMQFRVGKEIVGSFAGPIAEAKAVGAANLPGAATDHKAIALLATYITESEHEVQAFIAWLEVRATSLVETPLVRR